MAENKSGRVAATFSIAATIAAAAAYLNSRKVTTGGGVIPDEIVQLIIAIAAASGNIEAGVQQVVQELSTLGINVQGWPPNVRHIRTFTIVCAAAVQAYPGSQMAIPSGMSLVIKAHPLNGVGSLIYVATTAAESTNPNSAYPLVPNESVSYAMQDADQIFVSTNIAGSIAVFSAEQEP